MGNSTSQYNYRVLFALCLLLIWGISVSQNIVTDNTGRAAVSLNRESGGASGSNFEAEEFNQGLVKVSTADKKIELNYYRYFVSEKFTDFFVGLSGSGEMKNSASSLFSNGDFVSGAQANLKLGFLLDKRKFDPKVIEGKTDQEIQEILNGLPPAWNLWLVSNGNFEGFSFNRLSANLSSDTKIDKTRFSGITANIGLNFWSARVLRGTTLTGLTFGYKRGNNFDDLTEYKLKKTENFVDEVTGIEQTITNENTVYRGDYQEFDQFPVDFDYYYGPHGLRNLSFLFYSRVLIAERAKPTTKLGAGIYFLKKQDFFNPVAGVNFEFGDVFNTAGDQESNVWKRLIVGISTKVNITKSKHTN